MNLTIWLNISNKRKLL